MTTVFLSGSRRITRLGEEVRQRLNNMVENKLDIITGDANGADKAMQSYLANLLYQKVTIFFVGGAPRNNIGKWPTRQVLDEGNLRGRHFYAQKDREMSKIADFGFILWDGKSAGSVQNMLWLLSEGKKVVVYFAPEKRFYNFKSQDNLVELLARCDEESLVDMERKIALPDSVKKSTHKQASLKY
ncbi:MAG: hypothetical protein EXQ88_06495 [Alphaproteobacteria bacterium]|nr:hypothetical protein [Alphaproteobacteria bacterium]